MPTCPGCGAEVAVDARFCSSCGQSLASSDTAAFSHDELRPVTVLFADIVGSMYLGERLAPDEVKALVGECVTLMSRAVEEFGGVIQAYMGDGICAIFGVPRAHEDDPERAARAALRIIETVGGYSRDIEQAWAISDFNVRVGVNSGRVAVGPVGAGEPQNVALGDATNVAARLQSAAEPGTVAVGEATVERLPASFVLEPLGGLQLRGREAPVQAWRLTGAGRASEPQVGPLVGRKRELERLDGAASELRAGRGRVVLLVGEAGIGKTRLLRELRTRVEDNALWLQGHCFSYAGERPYGPFVEMLRTWAGIEEGQAEIAVRTKLRARVGALMGPDGENVLPDLGRLLGMRSETDAVSPEALAERVRRAYCRWVEALAAERPVALALEDLQWADGDTRRLAEELLDVSDRAPILLVVTLAPDVDSEGWQFRLRVLADFVHRAAEVGLEPLTEPEVERLVTLLHPRLTEVFHRQLVARAEGNPLYLHVFVRAVAEGADVTARAWSFTSGEPSLVPPALESLVAARLDRLPQEARRLAQIAAAIGRSFPARVLQRVSSSSSDSASIASLLRADIIREVRRYPELEYAFTHGLLQLAALSTLPPARQRELYARVAAAFEDLFSPALDSFLEQLAFYFAASGELDKALAYLERAADQAFAVGSGEHASAMWRRAEKLATSLGDQAARTRIQARLEQTASR